MLVKYERNQLRSFNTLGILELHLLKYDMVTKLWTCIIHFCLTQDRKDKFATQLQQMCKLLVHLKSHLWSMIYKELEENLHRQLIKVLLAAQNAAKV